MASRTRHVLAIVLVAAGAGCSATPPARFYTLASTAAANEAVAVRYAVVVGPVSIPGEVDRPQFVVHLASNRVEVDEFNRWAAPLGDAIARAVAGNLAMLLGTPNVATAPLANFNAAYVVTIDVQRFDSTPGETALIDAVWAVRATAGGATRSGRTIGREAVADKDFDALAAAHSRALATVSADIATAIRALAGGDSKPAPSGAKPDGRQSAAKKSKPSPDK